MTVPEVLFALVLLTVTFLSLMAVLGSGLRADKKGFVKQAASAVAEQLSAELRASLQDQPTRVAFWDQEKPGREAPYAQGVVRSGDTDFEYQICTALVRQPDGTVFNAPDRRLMQVEVYVRWGSDDTRAGFGSLVFHDQQILSEVAYGTDPNP
jgi:hypothetical protein